MRGLAVWSYLASIALWAHPIHSSEPVAWIRLLDAWRYVYVAGLAEMTGGGYYICGNTSPNYLEFSDSFVARLDEGGQSVWSKVLGGSGWDGFSCVLETADGGCIAAGGTTSKGYPDGAWIVRFDRQGRVRWKRSYADAGFVMGMAKRADGGVTVAAGGSLIKLDLNGKALWQRAYFDGPVELSFSRMIRTRDGGYVVADNEYDRHNNDSLIAKLNADGAVEWMKRLAHFRASGFVEGDDGAVSVWGFGSYYYDGDYLVRLDAHGMVTWQKSFTSEYDVVTVTAEHDGSQVVAGSVRLNSSRRAWLARVGASGDFVSQRMFDSGDRWSGFSQVEATRSGFLFGGRTDTYGKGVGQDGLLVNLPDSLTDQECPDLFIETSALFASSSVDIRDGQLTSKRIPPRTRPIGGLVDQWSVANRPLCASQ